MDEDPEGAGNTRSGASAARGGSTPTAAPGAFQHPSGSAAAACRPRAAACQYSARRTRE